MNKAQLKGDLDQIEQDTNRADMPESVKRILRDVLEWQRGMVDQTAAMDDRTDAIEDAVDELLNGAEEGISTETAKVILVALEQSALVCYTVGEALKATPSPFDELTTKRFRELIKQCGQSLAVAKQTTQELVMPDEDGGGPREPEEEEPEPEPEEDEVDEDEEDQEPDDGEGDEEVDNG